MTNTNNFLQQNSNSQTDNSTITTTEDNSSSSSSSSLPLLTTDKKIQNIENIAAASGFDFNKDDNSTLSTIYNTALDTTH